MKGRAFALALAVGCLVPQPTLAADWSGDAPWIAGASQYSQGEWIYQDYIYDDYGAAVPGQQAAQHGNLPSNYTAGSYRYPGDEDRYGNNSADLRQLRLAADADTVDVMAALTTLLQPDTTVVALSFDVDRDDATGGGPWPFAAGLTTEGTDIVVTLWGSDGAITDLRRGESSPVADVTQDLERNTIEATLPRSALADGPVEVQVATGIWDRSKREWLAPDGSGEAIPARAFNVGPRATESGSYMEDRQAAALASGDISDFQAEVDLEKLESGVTEPAPIEPGFHEGVMTQTVTIPPRREGMSFDDCVPGRSGSRAVLPGKFCYFGPHQPFGIYLPQAYDGSTPLPLALVLHGYGGTHAGYNAAPGFIRDMGEASPTVLLTPLARGPGGFYLDYAERDTFETLEFVMSKVPIDRERLYLTGYSMGGYGVFRLGSLYPDLFAAAVSWAGFSGELIGTRHDKADDGDAVDVLEGMLHVPVLQAGGTNDEILPVTGQLSAARRLDELGYRHRFDLYPGYDHFTFALVDEWSRARAWLGDLRRERRPARVAYRFSEAWGNPELGIRYDGAYWVSGLRVREAAIGDGSLNVQSKPPEMRTYGSILAESHALPRRAHTTRRIDEVRPGPPPFYETGLDWDMGDEQPLENRLDLTLKNLREVAIDAAQAGLRGDQPIDLVVDTDGPVTIALAGERIEIATAGTHELRLEPK